MIKVMVISCILLVLVLGIQYRPPQNFDYESASALQTKGGVTMVNFEFLGGFDYERSNKVPPKVKELNGKRIEIKGFMLPIDFEMGKVSSFMLMSSQAGCCFGVMPRNNEFIYAETPEGKTVKFMTDIPLTVTGVLHIGEDNLVGGLYTMTVEKIE